MKCPKCASKIDFNFRELDKERVKKIILIPSKRKKCNVIFNFIIEKECPSCRAKITANYLLRKITLLRNEELGHKYRNEFPDAEIEFSERILKCNKLIYGIEIGHRYVLRQLSYSDDMDIYEIVDEFYQVKRHFAISEFCFSLKKIYNFLNKKQNIEKWEFNSAKNSFLNVLVKINTHKIFLNIIKNELEKLEFSSTETIFNVLYYLMEKKILFWNFFWVKIFESNAFKYLEEFNGNFSQFKKRNKTPLQLIKFYVYLFFLYSSKHNKKSKKIFDKFLKLSRNDERFLIFFDYLSLLYKMLYLFGKANPVFIEKFENFFSESFEKEIDNVKKELSSFEDKFKEIRRLVIECRNLMDEMESIMKEFGKFHNEIREFKELILREDRERNFDRDENFYREIFEKIFIQTFSNSNNTLNEKKQTVNKMFQLYKNLFKNRLKKYYRILKKLKIQKDFRKYIRFFKGKRKNEINRKIKIIKELNYWILYCPYPNIRIHFASADPVIITETNDEKIIKKKNKVLELLKKTDFDFLKKYDIVLYNKVINILKKKLLEVYLRHYIQFDVSELTQKIKKLEYYL